jgi:hypothetical protein
MKVKETDLIETGVWEVRATGLPRYLIQAKTRSTAEALYKQRLNLRTEVVFVECNQCQAIPTGLKPL